MKLSLFSLILVLTQISCATSYQKHSTNNLISYNYPNHWWQPIPKNEKKPWEVSPDEAQVGVEVILSKRNELQVFSNLAETPFQLDGVDYQSIEGLWQGMKYPDPDLEGDPRQKLKGYKFKRSDVYKMSGFLCKDAGDDANRVMKQNGINWVSYGTEKFNYKDSAEGSLIHYKIISRAIELKIHQNPEVKQLLLKTYPLKLLPDHKIKEDSPQSYYYNEILMEIREKLYTSEEKPNS